MKRLIAVIGVGLVGLVGQVGRGQDTNEAPIVITGIGVYQSGTVTNDDGSLQDVPVATVNKWGDADDVAPAIQQLQPLRIRRAQMANPKAWPMLVADAGNGLNGPNGLNGDAVESVPTATEPPPVTGPGGLPIPFPTSVSNIVSQIDESKTNMFAPGEIEFRLGGVYSQQTGEGGTLLAVEKWDVLKENVGFGAESIENGTRHAAEFAYAAYRKILGNTAGLLFVGAGYDELTRHPLGVLGARLEYRTTKHIGAWTSVSYGFELNQKESRGLICGAGVSYAF